MVLELVGPGTTCRLWAEPPAEAPAEAGLGVGARLEGSQNIVVVLFLVVMISL